MSIGGESAREAEIQLRDARAEARSYGDSLHRVNVALERVDGEPWEEGLAAKRMRQLSASREEAARLRGVLQRLAVAAARVWRLADLPPRSPADQAYLEAERDAAEMLGIDLTRVGDGQA